MEANTQVKGYSHSSAVVQLLMIGASATFASWPVSLPAIIYFFGPQVAWAEVTLLVLATISAITGAVLAVSFSLLVADKSPVVFSKSYVVYTPKVFVIKAVENFVRFGSGVALLSLANPAGVMDTVIVGLMLAVILANTAFNLLASVVRSAVDKAESNA